MFSFPITSFFIRHKPTIPKHPYTNLVEKNRSFPLCQPKSLVLMVGPSLPSPLSSHRNWNHDNPQHRCVPPHRSPSRFWLETKKLTARLFMVRNIWTKTLRRWNHVFVVKELDAHMSKYIVQSCTVLQHNDCLFECVLVGIHCKGCIAHTCIHFTDYIGPEHDHHVSTEPHSSQARSDPVGLWVSDHIHFSTHSKKHEAQHHEHRLIDCWVGVETFDLGQLPTANHFGGQSGRNLWLHIPNSKVRITNIPRKQPLIQRLAPMPGSLALSSSSTQ